MGGEREAVHGWARGMKNQKCVLLLVLFHLVAQQVLGRRRAKGTKDRQAQHFTVPLRKISAVAAFLTLKS